MVTKQHRTAAEQRLWDAVVVELVSRCFDTGPHGCAHAVREIADAVLEERRQSQKQNS
jgi:hypothetical protein